MKTKSIDITVKKTRACPVLAREWGKKALNITVTAKAYTCGNNAHPYFTVTADIYKPDRSHNPIACGCMHEEVLRYFPEMAPLVALHLANADNGEPTYGEDNGFYWLAGALDGLGERYHGGSGDSGKSPDECLRIFAEHCRIELPEAEGIGRTVKDAFESGQRRVATSEVVTEKAREEMAKEGRRAAKADWKVICDDMRPRWKREAEAGLALLESMSTQPMYA
jgi:hypothetical protein